MYKVILFDADGMIIIAKRFSDQLQEQYDISWKNMEPFFKGPFQDCKIGRADLKEELTKVIQDWGWKKSVDELLDFWFECGAQLNEYMMDLIESLKNQGIACCLATNQEKYRAEFLRTQLEFEKLFDHIFTSADIGYLKSDPRFFEEAYHVLCQKNSWIQKSDILFCDDHEENIKTAQAFGFCTHLYQNQEGFEQAIQ